MKVRLIIISCIFFACSSHPKEHISNANDSTEKFTKEKNTEFLKVISTLPQLKLPLEIYCEKCCDMSNVDQDNESIRKYITEGTGLVGIIHKNEKHVSLLTTFAADMIVPVVRVYDLNGKQISEQSFMTDWCGREPDYLNKQYFRIGTDYVFSDIDSSYSFEMDSTFTIILDTTKIEIKETEYHITEDGLIIENNE